MPKRMLLGCSLALLLGACATKPQPRYLALEDHTRNSLQSVSVRSAVMQDEIVVRAESSAFSVLLGVGLMTAAIDHGVTAMRQESMQSAIEPFLSSVEEVDVRRQVAAALSAGLVQDLAVRIELPVESSAVPLDGHALAAKTAALKNGKGFLQVKTSYSFSEDFRHLNLGARVDLWQAGANGPVYSNAFLYQSGATSASGKTALAAWSENGGALYRRTLDEAVAQLVKMMRMDLGTNAAHAAPAEKKQPQHKLKRVGAFDVVGVMLEAQPGRSILRATNNGYLYSLPRD